MLNISPHTLLNLGHVEALALYIVGLCLVLVWDNFKVTFLVPAGCLGERAQRLCFATIKTILLPSSSES
jgi:hypothetical protein